MISKKIFESLRIKIVSITELEFKKHDHCGAPVNGVWMRMDGSGKYTGDCAEYCQFVLAINCASDSRNRSNTLSRGISF